MWQTEEEDQNAGQQQSEGPHRVRPNASNFAAKVRNTPATLKASICYYHAFFESRLSNVSRVVPGQKTRSWGVISAVHPAVFWWTLALLSLLCLGGWSQPLLVPVYLVQMAAAFLAGESDLSPSPLTAFLTRGPFFRRLSVYRRESNLAISSSPVTK